MLDSRRQDNGRAPSRDSPVTGLVRAGTLSITGATELNEGRTPREVTVRAGDKEFTARLRIDTPGEADYFRNGGILQYVLRSLVNA